MYLAELIADLQTSADQDGPVQYAFLWKLPVRQRIAWTAASTAFGFVGGFVLGIARGRRSVGEALVIAVWLAAMILAERVASSLGVPLLRGRRAPDDQRRRLANWLSVVLILCFVGFFAYVAVSRY
jgi:hypothetical protein